VSVITTFGAEVIVEDSCFFPYDGGQSSSPVLRISTGVDGTVPIVNAVRNFVSPTWLCPLSGDLQDDLSLLCVSGSTEEEASCTVPTGDINVFW
jgi:hypothetical protein